MPEEIHNLPPDEQLVIIKEVREYIPNLLQRAKCKVFRDVRLFEGLSIEELANRLGISPNDLSLIESESIAPSDNLAKQLTSLFKLDKPQDTNGNTALTFNELFFASIWVIAVTDSEKQKAIH